MLEWAQDKEASEEQAPAINSTLLAEQGPVDDDVGKNALNLLLKEHGSTTLRITKVWRWIHLLGFSYDARKKLVRRWT
jgi:hypothetical protein